MADKLKHMHWKKILLVGGILMVVLVAGLCVQKPEGTKPTPTPLQPAEELKLSDFPEAFKSTLIIVGDNTSDIEMQAANEIADYLENETGNKPLIKKHSEISDEDKRNYNLIVVGTPKTNPFLEEVYAMTDATKVTEEFPGEGKGILEILPNPWDESKAMLLVEGWDALGILLAQQVLIQREIEEFSIIATYIPGEVIVGFRNVPCTSNQAIDLIQKLGGEVKDTIPAINAAVVKVAVGKEQDFIRNISEYSIIKYAHLNGIVKLPEDFRRR